MSDDEADPELLELLRQTLGIGRKKPTEITSNTGVLKDAEYIYNNSIDVSIDMYGTKDAAAEIYKRMQQKSYSTETWMENELHPRPSEGFSENDMVNFVFTMDLLNFSFWSEVSSAERYQVEYRGRRWTGYNSLVACLRRALDEGVPITTPRYWRSQDFSDETARNVFRSATAEQIPFLEERIASLRGAGRTFHESFRSNEDEDESSDDALRNNDGSEHTESPSIDTAALSSDVDVQHTSDPVPLQQSFQQLSVDEGMVEHIQSPHLEIDDLDQDGLSPVGAVEAGQAISNDRAQIACGKGEEALLESTSPSHHPNTTQGQQHASDQVRSSADAPDVANAGVQSGTTAQLRESRTKSWQSPDHAVAQFIHRADKSAGKLVNLLAHHFSSFQDETRFDGRKVRLLKRAQILAADLWAALNGTGLGEFHDIDHLTMFADYRVPQVLNSLGVLTYSPPLGYRIQNLRPIESGHSWEVQLRGCSIWAVELIKREIVKAQPNAKVNAVLIDFFLYDLAKEREAQGVPSLPHHRTRSIWY